MMEERLTEEDHERIQEIMEIMRPEEWLESQPRFSEEYFKVALLARTIFLERKRKEN